MNHPEAQLQSSCVTWFRYQFSSISKMLIAIPNGGSRNIIEAANLKKQGVVSGVSDLILFQQRGGYGALCIEMKTKTGKQSTSQIEWQIEAEKNGYKYVICRSVDEFINEILDYMNL